MANCPTCKESILNQTESLIGQTQCNDPCPQDIACEDIIPSNCVFYSGVNLQCSGIVYGDILTNALQKIEQKLCNVSEKCFTWQTVDFDNIIDPLQGLEWRHADNSEVKYSTNTVSCQAGFQGVCTATIPASGLQVFSELFIIPANIRPVADRLLSTNVNIINQQQSISAIIPANIYIVAATGQVIVSFLNYNPLIPIPSGCAECAQDVPVASYRSYFNDALVLSATVSLDNLYYEINT